MGQFVNILRYRKFSIEGGKMSGSKNNFNRKIRFILNTIIVCGVPLFICLAFGIASSESQDYWPTAAWRTSSPESQGINSEVLVDMLSRLALYPNTIDSVTIIRNGYIVLDAYFYPFKKDKAHIIHSCTKSITSTLIGIAIDKGLIKDVHQRLLGFFPETTPANLTKDKENISLENILTMATGLECRDTYKDRWQGLRKMWQSSDWTQYMLDLSMNEPPGQNFEYCNGATYLLSAIIQKTTGMRSYKFAMKNLFTPIGITNVKWEPNPQGIDVGYGRMWLKPHDMARFGLLFLNKGKWQGNTIVSEEWVTESTRGYLAATLFDQYGYQWWVDEAGYYAAAGYGGQRIFVIPKHNMVVVFTSFKAFRKPDTLIVHYIIRAIESDSPLPENTTANTQLNELVEKYSKSPQAFSVPDLPPISQIISGVKYNIEPNEIGFENISFDFVLKDSVAIMEYSLKGKEYSVEVGLDGVYRTTELPEETVAFKGDWLYDDTFMFSYINVGHTEGTSSEIKFTGENAEISTIGPYGDRLRLKAVRD